MSFYLKGHALGTIHGMGSNSEPNKNGCKHNPKKLRLAKIPDFKHRMADILN